MSYFEITGNNLVTQEFCVMQINALKDLNNKFSWMLIGCSILILWMSYIIYKQKNVNKK